MTLKELLTTGEGTISATEAKALAAQCRMDEETLYTLLEERGIKVMEEDTEPMLDVNLTGAFHLCQLALPGMIRRKAGRILTVSSMWGQTGGSCEVHYSAA